MRKTRSYKDYLYLKDKIILIQYFPISIFHNLLQWWLGGGGAI